MFNKFWAGLVCTVFLMSQSSTALSASPAPANCAGLYVVFGYLDDGWKIPSDGIDCKHGYKKAVIQGKSSSNAGGVRVPTFEQSTYGPDCTIAHQRVSDGVTFTAIVHVQQNYCAAKGGHITLKTMADDRKCIKQTETITGSYLKGGERPGYVFIRLGKCG